MNDKKNTKTATTFAEAVNWEWVHAHHPKESGRVKAGPWLDRIIEHARENGYMGQITKRGAARIVNPRLY